MMEQQTQPSGQADAPNECEELAHNDYFDI